MTISEVCVAQESFFEEANETDLVVEAVGMLFVLFHVLLDECESVLSG